MKSILVIDDSNTIRAYLRLILEAKGYTVIEASNGKQGYALFKKESPSIVITDMLMPEMDGLEIIQRLKIESPKTKIIAMSDGGSFQGIPFVDMCQKFGVKNFINKPIDKELLLNLLEELY